MAGIWSILGAAMGGMIHVDQCQDAFDMSRDRLVVSCRIEIDTADRKNMGHQLIVCTKAHKCSEKLEAE